MQPRKLKWRSTFISGIGVLLAVSGATLAIFWDDIFFSMLSKELQLTPTSKTYDVWKKTPIPMYLDFYFFNWTNPEHFLNTSIKPSFVEMGPYRFREVKTKVNITFHENNTVSYRQQRNWYFEKNQTRGSLDDEITTLNVVSASAVYSSRNWGYLRQKGVSLGLGMFHETIEVTKTVRQLLFDGYEDALLDFANSVPQAAAEGVPKVDKFGWFYQRNGSSESDGYINMATGVDDISMLGKAMNWNNASSTKFYSGHCADVIGSAGELYPPKVTKSGGLSLFTPDLCRSISFDFDEVINVHGIHGYKFSGNSKVFDNGTHYEANKCYCAGECQPSGALNVSKCRHGSPAFVSFPHFYLADDYYINAIEGMHPEKDKHHFFLALEPMTGVPLDVAARLQINILVQPSANIALYENVPKIFIPILWFEQRVTLNEEFASGIRQLLLLPLIGNIVALLTFVVGIVVLLWLPVRVNVAACIRKMRNPKPNETVVFTSCTKETEVCMLPSAVDNLEKINEDSENESESEARQPLNTSRV